MIFETASVALLLALVFFVYRQGRPKRLPLPPGPPGYPLLGNIFDQPEYPWKGYHQFAKDLDSDLVHLNMAGKSIMIIDKYETMVELFEGRSTLYSSRPPVPMLMELAGWDWAFSWMKYGAQWRAHRKMVHHSFSVQGSKQFRPQQVESSRAMLKGLLKSPDHFVEHMQLMASRVVLGTLYGHDDVDSIEHEYVGLADRALSPFTTNLNGGILVNVFPFWKRLPTWMPGTDAVKRAQVWRNDMTNFREKTMDDAQTKIRAGTAKPSFVSAGLDSITKSDDYTQQHDLIKQVAATTYGAAFETTASTLKTFFLAMAVFPEVQRKAQTYIDKALGGDLPSFDDQEAIPYMQAVVMETLRWHPAVPLSMPHYIETEDVYRNYRIPANTMVFPNNWAMLHEESHYPDPHTFNPDRFLDEKGNINPSIRDPLLIAFGVGRRICPGKYYAEATLWIAMTSILSVFEISDPVDMQGRKITPLTAEFTPGLASAPKPFKCIIRPRSKKAEHTIRSL